MRRGKGKPRTGARSARKDSALALATRVPIRHHLRTLDRRPRLGRPGEPDELRVRPGERRRAERAFPLLEARFAGRRAPVPDLLGQHPAAVGGLRHVLQQRVRRAPREQLVLPPLAREDRPGATERAAGVVVEQPPRLSVAALAITVEGVAGPEVTRPPPPIDD